MTSRVLVGLTAIVVLGGGGAGFVWWRAYNEVEQSVAELLRNVDSELTSAEVDRDSTLAVIGRVRKARAAHDRPELVRAESRLLRRVGRAREAWEVIEPLATTPGAEARDTQLGARLVAQVHASTGLRDDAERGIALAREDYATNGAVGSLFLAWQLAYRATQVRRFASYRRELLEDHEDSREAKLVRLVTITFAEHLADRLGIPPDADWTQLARGADDADDTVIAKLVLEAKTSSAGSKWSDFAELESQWEQSPPELELMIALGEIDGKRDLDSALLRLRTVIETVPCYIEARHAIVVAYLGLGEGDSDRCRGQARWLLQNAPDDDTRRQLWQRVVG